MIAPKPDVVYYAHLNLLVPGVWDDEWLADSKKDGHATVAMEFQNECSVIWSVAWCAPGDKFDKRLGKEIATRRLQGEDDRFSIIYNFCPKRYTSYYQIAKVLLEIERLKITAPSWAQSPERVVL